MRGEILLRKNGGKHQFGGGSRYFLMSAFSHGVWIEWLDVGAIWRHSMLMGASFDDLINVVNLPILMYISSMAWQSPD
jgi:hypothetical protein